MPQINLTGKTILGYTVQEKLGSGASGTVYRAVKVNPSGQYVRALKHITVPTDKQYLSVLNSMGGDVSKADSYFSGMLDGIVSEIRILNGLTERGVEHIVRYYENDIETTDYPRRYDIYILMEYLTPLDDYMLNHEFTVNDVVDLGLDILEGLKACHDNGVIHRDIKNDNIFVSNDGQFKIGDFGVSKILKDTSRAESMKGTPEFLAPEVYLGKESYTKSVDLYSLGIVLYRLLNYGRNPFLPHYPENYTVQDKDAAFEKRMKGGVPDLPSLGGEKIGSVVAQAISDKEIRFQSAEAFFSALNDAAVNTDGETLGQSVKFDIPKRVRTGMGTISDVDSRTFAETIGEETLSENPDSYSTSGTSGADSHDDGQNLFKDEYVPPYDGNGLDGGIPEEKPKKKWKKPVAAICTAAAVAALGIGIYAAYSSFHAPTVDSMTYDQFASDYQLPKGDGSNVENAYNDAVTIDFKDVKRTGRLLNPGYSATAVVHMPDMEDVYGETTSDQAVVSKLSGISSEDLSDSEAAVRVQSSGELTADSAEDLNDKIRGGYYSVDQYDQIEDYRKSTGSGTAKTVSSSKKSGDHSVITMVVSAGAGYGNVREGRGMKYDVAGTLDNGTLVAVTDLEDGWYQVASGTYSGKYMSSKILTPFSSDDRNALTVYINEEDGSDVKEGKKDSSDTAKHLDYGDEIVGIPVSGNFWKIATGPYKGYYIPATDISFTVPEDSDTSSDSDTGKKTVTMYVSSEDGYATVRDSGSDSAGEAGEIENGEKVKVTGLKKGWYRIKSGDYQDSYIKKSDLVADEDDVQEVDSLLVFADAGYANIRDGSSKDSDIVGTLDNGTEIDVLQAKKGNKWRKIVSGEYKGSYISKAAVAEDYDPKIYTKYVKAGAGYANVRDGRSTDDEILGHLDNGTEVDVKWLKKGWYMIDSGEYEGKYLSKKVLTDEKPDSPSKLSETEAKEKAITCARDQAEREGISTEPMDTDDSNVIIAESSEDAYIISVGLFDTNGDDIGAASFVWVDRNTGSAKFVMYAQDYETGWIDIDTGEKNVSF